MTLFNTKFSFVVHLAVPNITTNARWMQNGITVAGGNGPGTGPNQLSHPWGICVYDDQTLYVADQGNDRIMEWKNDTNSGQIVVGRNRTRNRFNQLRSPKTVIIDKTSDCLIISCRESQQIVRWPRQNGTTGATIISNIDCWSVAMDNDGYLYVSDASKSEVRRWQIGDTNGTIVAGGNGQGGGTDQLNFPLFISVDHDHSVYVSDYSNHRVIKWVKGAKEGIVVAGGQGQGSSLTQLSDPLGIVVDQLGTIYVADQNNHRVTRWLRGATQGSVIVGGNGQGVEANQLNRPCGLSFDRQNNLYVVDNNNHRVQIFNIE